MHGPFRRSLRGRNALLASLLLFGGCVQGKAAPAPAVPAPSDTSPITAGLSVDWKA